MLSLGNKRTLARAAVIGSIAAASFYSVWANESPEDHSETLDFTKWSGDLNIPDPVSISFDNEGRAYVTQTQRRKSQDLDIRLNRDWIADDVGLNSVEAKKHLFRSRMSSENSAANAERVADLNGDGIHDYRDLRVLSERIFRVEDSDGDGIADRKSLFAEDFNTEVTGIAAGVLWNDGDVYATVAPDVWKLRDTNGDGVADQRSILSTGFGNHIAYAGHDMHGLIMGPDGKLYWSIGDKGINTVSQEGERFYFPHQGGVMRCNPDGSDFEVFAHGLRNVQEFAFDAYGNWFGVDNDSDQSGESERFVYIVPGMDVGWRNYYQYRRDEYNPWMAERLWVPHFESQPAYIVPTIQNYVDGPAGFVFNPGTALNPQYRDYFFVNSTLQGSQWAFQVKPNGASFDMVNSHKIGEGIPLVGLTVGPDGALYSVDWGGGYPLNEKGAIWKIDDQSGADRSARDEVAALLSEGLGSRGIRQLAAYLSHADQRIRLQAQFELVRRNDVKTLRSSAGNGDRIQRVHAIWGLGQLARLGSDEATETLLAQLDNPDTELIAQAVKMLADLKVEAFDGNILAPLLSSSDPRVRFQVALAVGAHKVDTAWDSVVALVEENDGRDLYLRHAGVMALAGIGGAERLSEHSSEAVRQAAVVALRRNRSPRVAAFLSDPSLNVVREAALAIHDDRSIPEALPMLAQLLEEGLLYEDVPLVLRAINANLRLGAPANARRVARFAANEAQPSSLRVAALAALNEWVDTPVLDRVDGRHRLLGARSMSAIASSVAPALNALLDSNDSAVLEGVVSASQSLAVDLNSNALFELLVNSNASSELRVLALESLDTMEAIEEGLGSSIPELRSTAAEMLVSRDPYRASQLLADRLNRSDSLVEQQGALSSLAEIDSAEANEAIGAWAKRLEEDAVPAGLQLDVLEAAAKKGFSEAIAAFDSRRASDDSLSAFEECLEGGDVMLGERIVNTHLGAQCVRCHRFSNNLGSKIGPNLKNSGALDNAYLLRSLVDPQADIAQGFGIVTVSLQDGGSVSGVIGKETDETVEVLALDGSAKVLDRAVVVSITDAVSSMPPMGYVLTKRELRDVVAYLASLKN